MEPVAGCAGGIACRPGLNFKRHAVDVPAQVWESIGPYGGCSSWPTRVGGDVEQHGRAVGMVGVARILRSGLNATVFTNRR